MLNIIHIHSFVQTIVWHKALTYRIAMKIGLEKKLTTRQLCQHLRLAFLKFRNEDCEAIEWHAKHIMMRNMSAIWIKSRSSLRLCVSRPWDISPRNGTGPNEKLYARENSSYILGTSEQVLDHKIWREPEERAMLRSTRTYSSIKPPTSTLLPLAPALAIQCERIIVKFTRVNKFR